MQQATAFELLASIRQQAIELGEQNISYTSQATGVKNIAYIVNGVHFYSDSGDIKEVSVCESLTPIPQTKPWLRGLINSKGILYSVTDLSLLAGYGRATSTNRGHLLLLNDADIQSALLVNRVVGFRYFDSTQTIADFEEKREQLDGLSSFVKTGCRLEEQDWYQLDIDSLLASEQFREVQ